MKHTIPTKLDTMVDPIIQPAVNRDIDTAQNFLRTGSKDYLYVGPKDSISFLEMTLDQISLFIKSKKRRVWRK